MSLILANGNDLVVGKSAPWPLYDQNREPLLDQGEIVRDDGHRDLLLAKGACYELAWEKPGSEPGDDEAKASEEPAPVQNNKNAGEESFSFDDLKLRPEDRLQLEPPAQLARERFSVKVIGFVRDVSLLVTIPITPNGLRLQLMENEKVVMRSFSGQNAFGFACTIKRIIKIPYEYMHLSFPDNIQGIKIRKAPRIKTRIIATVSDSAASSAEKISALISDISASGISLESKQPLGEKGSILNLAFRVQLHNVEAFLSVKGAIRAVLSKDPADVSKPDLIRHGIEFHNLQPNDSVILQSMIYQQLIENPSKVI